MPPRTHLQESDRVRPETRDPPLKPEFSRTTWSYIGGKSMNRRAISAIGTIRGAEYALWSQRGQPPLTLLWFACLQLTMLYQAINGDDTWQTQSSHC